MGKISGIYKITHKESKKVYIGQSTDVKERLKDHKRRLNNNKHDNSYLQNSWNKYGENAFDFSVIEELTKDFRLLNEREVHWITYYDSLNKQKGYNIAFGGGNSYSLAGKSEEEKIIIFKKMGVTQSLKYSGVNAPNYGKIMSEEQKKKISNSLKGSKNPNYNKERKEHSEKMKGANNPRSKKIICTTTNEIFECAKYAAEKYNTTNSNILKGCRGKRNTAGRLSDGTRLVWEYCI